MNNSAQVHVLEVVIVAGLLLFSLYFVRTFEFAPSSIVDRENKFEILGESILASLESVPSSYDNYSNVLAEYVGMNDAKNFSAHVNATLPEGAFYNITVVNISAMHKFAKTQEECSTFLFRSIVKVGQETVSSRIVVIDSYIYEVQLKIYFTLR